MPVVEGEAHEPDVTFFVVEFMDDGDVCVVFFEFLLVEQTGFPAHDRVLATLQAEKLQLQVLKLKKKKKIRISKILKKPIKILKSKFQRTPT